MRHFMPEAWLFALAYRSHLPDTVDLISCSRSSKYCRFMVTNVGKDGTFLEYNCFFTMDLFWCEEIVSGIGAFQEI